jgi:hypothetical protein
VGPAGADQLRDEHFALLRDAVASGGGREVKNTGDGLMVVFRSPSAAIRCAVRMQQLLERRYRDAGEALTMRIGIGAGESTVRDGDYFGIPTIEAARLCDKAAAEGILVSAAAKMLAGHVDDVEFGDGTALELKGFPEPVVAHPVRWAPLSDEASDVGGWPLPGVLRAVPAISYVGRVDERSKLESALAAARGGVPGVTLVSGEPGIGKTRLAAYSAHRAHARGFAIAWGSCSEDFAVAYEPWIDVCTQLVAGAPAALLSRHVDRFRGELQRVAPNLASRVTGLPAPQVSDTETERYLLFSAIAGLLQEVAAEFPLCVVLDDLHWADSQSVALLRHIWRGGEHGALHVIATYRDSDLGKDHPLSAVLADLLTVDGARRIELRGLAPADIGQILASMYGHTPDAAGVELADEIARETDGNPFFVGEILRGLAESGALSFDEAGGGWNVDRSSLPPLPESVREVIRRRVERLGPDAAETLRLAAVIGREFDVDLLTASSEAEPGAVLDSLETAVAASLLGESSDRIGLFYFEHALINQTLYEALGPTRRARLHHQVAVALEQSPQDSNLAELALHWRLSAADAPRAASYALRAGEQALERLAPAEAATLFGDALEMLGDEPNVERCKALIGLGLAQRQTGEGGYRETLLAASALAEELGDGELAAMAALANSRGSYSLIGEVDAELLGAIECAIRLDEPSVPARRARLLALLAQELEWSGEQERRRALADEALSIARSAGDERARAGVLLNAFYAYWSPQTVELSESVARELTESVRAAQDPGLAFWAQIVRLNVAIERGEPDAAECALDDLSQNAHRLGQPILTWVAAYNRAGWELMRAPMPVSETLVEHAYELGQHTGEPDAVFLYGAQLASMRAYGGRGDEIIEMLEQSVQAYPDFSGWRAAMAHVYCLIGREEEASEVVERAASDRFDHVARDQTFTSAMAMYADAAAQVGAKDAAARLYELIEPWSDRIVWNGAAGFGHAEMWLAQLAATLGREEDADARFARSIEHQDAVGLALWATYARVGWAQALAARGDTDRARTLAERAGADARTNGYGALTTRAETLLADTPA